MQEFLRDFLVFGSGIAGLWIFDFLFKQGYSVSLIESNLIGGTQTLGSQGMIHGGQKYSLAGKVDDLASNVAKMPFLWDQCLKGEGEIDLSNVEVLANEQIMWPDHNLISVATSYAAAKSVNSETTSLSKKEIPEVLINNGFSSGYSLQEKVMDAKSLVQSLIANKTDYIHKASIKEIDVNDKGISSIVLEDEKGLLVKVSASKFIFACGVGNEEIASMLNIKSNISQRRPLRQVMVKTLPHPLYGHCITTGTKPRVTITSHPYEDKGYVWYLGANIAEKGIDMDDEEQIRFAKDEMSYLFPKINWDNVEWSTWDVDRSEAFEPKGGLMPGPQLFEHENALIIWPTKMTFAPALSYKMIDWIEKNQCIKTNQNKIIPILPPEIGSYPWENTTWKRVS
jgi:glycerol-3-phosphate dehydrogenase